MPNPSPEEINRTMAHLRALEEIMRDFDAGKIDKAEAQERIKAADRLHKRLGTFLRDVPSETL